MSRLSWWPRQSLIFPRLRASSKLRRRARNALGVIVYGLRAGPRGGCGIPRWNLMPLLCYARPLFQVSVLTFRGERGS